MVLFWGTVPDAVAPVLEAAGVEVGVAVAIPVVVGVEAAVEAVDIAGVAGVAVEAVEAVDVAGVAGVGGVAVEAPGGIILANQVTVSDLACVHSIAFTREPSS
jgi:hypothetical protein